MKTDMSKRAATDRQLEVLKYISRYTADHGFPPTFRDIGDHFMITSKGAFEHIQALKAKGYISCEANKSRSMVVLKAGER